MSVARRCLVRTRRSRRAVVGLALIALAAFGACNAERSLQQRILEDLTTRVILPDYRELAARATALREAAERLRASPSAETLEAAQAAWRETRSAWSRGQAHLVGPEVDLFLDAKIDSFPASEAGIEALVAAATPLDGLAIERLGANAKGFAGLELLLFDAPASDGGRLLALTQGDGSRRRLETIVALAANLEDVTHELRDLWEPGQGGFATQLASAGTSSSALPTRDAAFDLLINRMVSFTEWVADVHLARPAGRGVDPVVPHPELVRARRSGQSLQDAADQIEGLRQLYQGPEGGLGLGALVAQAAPDLDVALREAFVQASERITSIPPPLDQAMIDAPDAVRLAFESAKALQVRIATDLVSVYQTTLRVVRFDGD